jgi:peptide/nickel transport system substrate-binding protein
LVAPRRLRTRYASQLHTTAGQWTNSLFLNATKPPFDKHDARRAVAYALDRGGLTSRLNWLSGPVTCQLIPPDFAAYQPNCPFTLGGGADGKWAGPDVPTAQDLVKKSGTRGAKVVLAVYADPFGAFRETGNRVVAMLDRLGYRASLRVLTDFDDLLWVKAPNARLANWAADYPAASNYVASLGSCDPDGVRSTGRRTR